MKALDIIMIPVKDRQLAKEFYLKLGFQVVSEAPDQHGNTWIQMGLPGHGTTVSLAAFHGLIFETEDIEKEVRRIEQQGIEVGEIDDQPYGKFAWFKDLDGNGICLREKK